MMPPDRLEALKTFDTILLGAAGDPGVLDLVILMEAPAAGPRVCQSPTGAPTAWDQDPTGGTQQGRHRLRGCA